MDRIAIAGVSLHGTDVAGLERVRRPTEGATGPFLRELADVLGASELVFLATCNRAEVIYAREVGDLPGHADIPPLAEHLALGNADELRGELVQRHGLVAARHLFRVTASLDSLVVGDDQIITQVREALEAAEGEGLVGPLLRPLFRHAFEVAKQVRTDTDLARHPVSIVNLGVSWLAEQPRCEEMAVAVVGAGRMGSLLAAALAAAGLGPAVIANRSVAAARAVAEVCGAQAVPLDHFVAGDVPVDALVAVTSAPGAILDAEALRRLAARTPGGGPLCAVDLAVPRDLADPEDERVVLVDLDDLRAVAERNHTRRTEAAALGEDLVERKLAVLGRRVSERLAAPAVTELKVASEELLRAELARLAEGRLARLSDEDRRAVERWARGAFSRLSHLPVQSLKQLANDLAEREDLD